METKYVTFENGSQSARIVQWTDKASQEISASLARANISNSATGCSLAASIGGQQFSTSSPAPAQTSAQSKPAIGLVSFKGGGPPPDATHTSKQKPAVRRVAASSVLSVGGSVDIISVSRVEDATPLVSSGQMQEYDEQLVVAGGTETIAFELSDDGGMMFSAS